MIEPASDQDLAVMAEQLGRDMRGVIGISARCVCGKPTVVATRPQLPDGQPFPTLYYLTHPAATLAVSRLEGTGIMAEWTAELSENEDLAAQYLHAHQAYLADRAVYGEVPQIAGISAGGMPARVKCLHALLAHTLSVGRGVNPIGDRVLEQCRWSPEVCECQP